MSQGYRARDSCGCYVVRVGMVIMVSRIIDVINSASLVCLRLRFVIFASFEMVDFGFLWDLRADEYI